MKYELKRIGIDTGAESVAFLSSDSLMCRCLGLHPLDRVAIEADGRTLLSALDGVTGDAITPGAVGLSDYAFERLGLPEGRDVDVRPAEPPASAEVLPAPAPRAHALPLTPRARPAPSPAGQRVRRSGPGRDVRTCLL